MIAKFMQKLWIQLDRAIIRYFYKDNVHTIVTKMDNKIYKFFHRLDAISFYFLFQLCAIVN